MKVIIFHSFHSSMNRPMQCARAIRLLVRDRKKFATTLDSGAISPLHRQATKAGEHRVFLSHLHESGRLAVSRSKYPSAHTLAQAEVLECSPTRRRLLRIHLTYVDQAFGCPQVLQERLLQ